MDASLKKIDSEILNLSDDAGTSERISQKFEYIEDHGLSIDEAMRKSGAYGNDHYFSIYSNLLCTRQVLHICCLNVILCLHLRHVYCHQYGFLRTSANIHMYLEQWNII